MANFSLYIGLCKQKVLWNNFCLFVSHFFSWSVKHFFRSHWLVFPDLFIKLHYLILELNSVFAENLFLLIFGQQKIQNYSILFWKFYNLVFLKGVWKENYCDTWNPTPKTISGKIPVLKLLSKIPLLIRSRDFKKSNISKVN